MQGLRIEYLSHFPCVAWRCNFLCALSGPEGLISGQSTWDVPARPTIGYTCLTYEPRTLLATPGLLQDCFTSYVASSINVSSKCC